MKKILSIGILLLGVIMLSSCDDIIDQPVFEIAMITDSGDIDDKSFNQGTWEGIVAFAEANDLTYKYYKPTEVSNTAYVAAIDLAVLGGAKIIVTPGFLFEPAIYAAQTKYPDVKFVLIDGVPHPGDYTTFNVAANTRSILFKEQESGFLAGYAAVKEGFRNLGFMGGIAVPAVVRFGLGFVAGAYYAANELELTDFTFNLNRYAYLGTFAPGDAVKAEAASWFATGVEVIHVAAGGAGNSVMAAAEEGVNKFVIGVDIDQASQSNSVISSALKALGVVVQQALQDYIDGNFIGGTTVTLGAADDAVGLPLGDSFKFTNFTVADYNAILAKLADGTIVLPMDTVALQAYIDALIANDPVDPVDPTDPVDPVDPVDPTDPVDPAETEPEVVKVPGINILKDLNVDDETTLLEGYVFSTYHAGSLINIATKNGTVSVSYFSADADLKTQMALINVGDFIDVTGKVMISTGGDQARSKHIVPTAFSIVENSTWIFDGFISAATIDMDTEFKNWADNLTNNDFGVVYTFTNVRFMTVGSATLTGTGYDYLNYTALVADKNQVLSSASNFYRIGFYHFALDTTLFNTTDTYTIQAFMIGTNQNLPWSGTANPILRLSGFVAIIE